jgi:putative ABC transport system permease protein
MMSVAAAGLGTLFAWWATPFVVSRIHPANSPMPLWIGPDWMVFAFGMALTVGVSVLSGLIPALRASEVRPSSALKGGEKPRTGIRWMQGMIAAQVGFCFVVLFAAGLFVSTLVRLTRQPLGFSPEQLLVVDAESRQPQAPVKWEQIAQQLSQMPGVQSASLESWPLLSGGLMTRFISVNSVTWKSQPVYFLRVSPGWLGTMRIPLLSGRDLRAEDREPGRAIVNETFAKLFFGGADPVGRRFEAPTSARPGSQPFTFEIVGLVPTTIYADLREPDLPVAYTPFQTLSPTGTPVPVRYASIEVRTQGDPTSMEQSLRRAVMQIDPEFSVNQVTTQEELAQDQLLRERLLATLAGFFAGVALLLAAIGLYGVLHYSVVQREKEIGIRIALGATLANISRLVTGRLFVMVLVGVGIGLGLGVASVRFVTTLLYGSKATDVSMMTIPAAVLLATTCLAALPGVLRAVRIDPVMMLRNE